MNPRDASFNAHEQLEVLAEIIKASNVHPESLVQFIRQHGINPNWGDVALPRGRTVNQCSNWFYSIINQTGPSGPISGHMRSQSLHEPGPSASLKRPFSPDQPSFAGGRLLVPKPPMSTIGNILNQPAEPPKKKRGRPTNAEKAARREQEIARGQPAPTHRRELPIASGSSSGQAIRPGPSSIATYAAQAAMTPHPRDQPGSANTSDSSSSKKKKGRPSNAEKEARRLQQEPAESQEAVSEPSRPGPSRYPNILSSEDQPRASDPTRPEGSPSRGDPAAYR